MNSSNSKANGSFTQGIKNATSKGVQAYQGSSSMGKIIFFIILVLFIAFLIYIIYVAVKSSKKANENSPFIVNDVIDAFVARPAFKLPQVTQGMNQSFSTWIYVKDWNYKFGQYKNILWKGNPPNASTTAGGPTVSNIHSPSIWLYPLTNSLKVVTSTSAPEQVESCDIPNIPLMTWVHIGYVLNNRTVDIYINGKLERSCALRGIPVIDNSPVYITTGANGLAGFYGKISCVRYFTKALLPNEIADIYQKGPLGTTQYQIQFFNDGNFITINNKSPFGSDDKKKNKSEESN